MTRTEKLNTIVTKKLDPRLISDLDGKRDNNGNAIRYISGEAMLVLLREAFGPYYSIEFGEPRIVQYAKVQSRSGEYTPSQVVEVKCTLTVPIKDEETGETILVKREGFGSAAMKSHFEEMVLKTAQTDAMKKAAYSFGFALELFMKDGGEKDWADAEMYGIWTQTSANEHRNELAFVNGVIQQYKLPNLDAFAVLATGDQSARTTPTNIGELVKAFQKKMKQKEEKAA